MKIRTFIEQKLANMYSNKRLLQKCSKIRYKAGFYWRVYSTIKETVATCCHEGNPNDPFEKKLKINVGEKKKGPHLGFQNCNIIQQQKLSRIWNFLRKKKIIQNTFLWVYTNILKSWFYHKSEIEVSIMNFKTLWELWKVMMIILISTNIIYILNVIII